MNRLQITVDKVREKGAKEVREGDLTILIVVQAPAESLDVGVRDHVP